MTRGEMWLHRRKKLLSKVENLEIKLDLDDVDITAGLPKPMSRDEAIAYYNGKLRRYWRESGYYKPKGLKPSLEWVQYWVQRAYEAGYSDALEEMNGKAAS